MKLSSLLSKHKIKNTNNNHKVNYTWCNSPNYQEHSQELQPNNKHKLVSRSDYILPSNLLKTFQILGRIHIPCSQILSLKL